MKKSLALIVTIAAVTGLHSFRLAEDSTITGKVVPPDGAEAVWAISNVDSVRATLNAGAFSISVANGTYKVVIDGKEPFQNAIIENVQVKDGQNTDLGEIRLQQ